MKRVVCGINEEGTSTTVSVGAPPRVYSDADGGLLPGYEFCDLWAPADGGLDLEDRTTSASGFSIVVPVGAAHFKHGIWPPTPGPAIMHRTDTIDYLTAISGSIVLMMEDGTETVVHAGDVVVQLGGVHAWWNKGPNDFVASFVMVGVEPTESR